tara:strand:+ start:150 stop:434 length:285 start_codon:yes stop_codon:yes gene_type:complete
MIDCKTERLMDKARRKKLANKRRQRTLYERGKKQGGKYTHDINSKGNTVTGRTIRKLMERLDDKKEREKTIALEKLRRKTILKKIKSLREKMNR